jgi:hypothetical protein
VTIGPGVGKRSEDATKMYLLTMAGKGAQKEVTRRQAVTQSEKDTVEVPPRTIFELESGDVVKFLDKFKRIQEQCPFVLVKGVHMEIDRRPKASFGPSFRSPADAAE